MLGRAQGCPLGDLSFLPNSSSSVPLQEIFSTFLISVIIQGQKGRFFGLVRTEGRWEGQSAMGDSAKAPQPHQNQALRAPGTRDMTRSGDLSRVSSPETTPLTQLAQTSLQPSRRELTPLILNIPAHSASNSHIVSPLLTSVHTGYPSLLGLLKPVFPTPPHLGSEPNSCPLSHLLKGKPGNTPPL